jgi:hypothetical protein
MVLLLGWLVTSKASPLAAWAGSHRWLGSGVGRLNLLPDVAAAMASGNLHQPSAFVFYVAAFLQWFLVAFVVIAIWQLLRRALAGRSVGRSNGRSRR